MAGRRQIPNVGDQKRARQTARKNVFWTFFQRFSSVFWTFGVQRFQKTAKRKLRLLSVWFFPVFFYFGNVFFTFFLTFVSPFSEFFWKLRLIYVFLTFCYESGRKPPNVNWTLRAFVATTKPARALAHALLGLSLDFARACPTWALPGLSLSCRDEHSERSVYVWWFSARFIIKRQKT